METSTLILLCIVSFSAGFVDAIVGGGGLIQVPAALILMPHYPVVNVIGTLKIPAFSGTSFAAFQYSKKVKMNGKLLFLMMAIAFVCAFVGSWLLTLASNAFMKPVLLVILTLVAIYTYTNKGFGQHTEKNHSYKKLIKYSVLISLVISLYDGFIGPGSGSFLILGFIALMGYDFLHASANAKLVNVATNLGSICLFLLKGKILWAVALPMAASNSAGGWIGAKLAIDRGNKFIRIFFLLVVIGTLIRFAYDVVMGWR
ncbi:MAG: hypothetical protein K0S09_1294 [Sphingobacteriaceae bacterium]|jgi:uncharacterized membrane protein YfcA|nr:hypothetical protein [Sphingobacteriaceae bacterium]